MAPQKHAVLIGIDNYFGATSNLKGCVNDVNEIAIWLCNHFHFEENNIHKLVSPRSDGINPNLLPTYRRVVGKITTIIKKANEGDTFFLHYSGHGSRTRSKIEGNQDQRESLVLLFDDAQSKANISQDVVSKNCVRGKVCDLQDVEIASLVRKMIKKNLVVTIIFDCCFSAGVIRGEDGPASSDDSQTRGVDLMEYQVFQETLFCQNELEESRGEDSSSPLRTAELGRIWMLELQNFAFIAACRSNEHAAEHIFHERKKQKWQGLLSGCLVRIPVREGGLQTITYDMVYNLLRNQFQDLKKPQHVEFNGRRQQLFLDIRDCPWHEATVEKYIGNAKVRLNAGAAHGIVKGARLAIYRSNERLSDLTKYHKPLTYCEIDTVRTWDSDATLNPANAHVKRGAKVVRGLEVLRNRIMSLKSAVLDLTHDASSNGNRIQHKINSYMDMSGAKNEKPHFFSVRSGGEQGSGGSEPVCIVKLTNGAGEVSTTVGDLTKVLTHLSIFENVRTLGSKGSTRLSAKILGTIENLGPEDSDPAPWDEEYFQEIKRHLKKPKTKDPTWVPNGHQYILEVTNNTRRSVSITILSLEPSWMVRRLYPRREEAVMQLEHGRSKYFPLQTSITEDHPNKPETLVVLAAGEHYSELPDTLLPALNDAINTAPIDEAFRTEGHKRPSDPPVLPEWAATRVEILPFDPETKSAPTNSVQKQLKRAMKNHAPRMRCQVM